MTLGMLDLGLSRALAVDGKGISPILSVEDRLITGKKAKRHEASGDALTRDQWGVLPHLVAAAKWYEDTVSGNLVAVMGVSDEVSIKAVFTRNGKADSLFTVPAVAINGAVKGGKLKLLEGGRGT